MTATVTDCEREAELSDLLARCAQSPASGPVPTEGEPPRPPFVLFGAGALGRHTLAALRKGGVEPLAFADNNAGLWGRIPLWIRSIFDDYHLFLRRYCDDCWELVCYAIPSRRMKP